MSFSASLFAFLLPVIGWIFPPVTLPESVVTRQVLKEHCPELLWSNLHDRLELIRSSDQSSPEKFLRVGYPKGGVGTNDSGAQMMFGLPPALVATCEYQVRFAEGFDFVKGGKLPGLAGGKATSGLKRPTGDGWTARLMWRKRGAAVLYLYHMDQRRRQGDDFPLSISFRPGVWHQVRQEVRVNQPGKSDGRIQIWIDGKKSLDQQSLRLRSGDQAPVDRFYFSTFFGGSGVDWAPSEDQTVDFASIEANSLDTDR